MEQQEPKFLTILCRLVRESDKKTFSIEAVKLAHCVLENFNKLDLRELQLVENGKLIEIPDKIFEEWELVGMRNSAFVSMRFWENPDILKEE